MRLGAATLAVLLVVGAACSGDDDDSATGKDQGSGDATTTTSLQPLPERRPFDVGSRTETLVDPSRPTPAVPAKQLVAHDDRTIELTVLYPTDEEQPPVEDAGIVDHLEAPADTDAKVAAGELPLLVFAHGWSGSGASLVGPARRWAAAGYVVALPTFPLSKEPVGFSDDVINQPGDVSFVIDTLLADAKDADSYLDGHIDADRIAVGGHSLGSVTAFGFQNSCCKDPRVKAIVAASGGPQPYSTGDYDKTFATPMLLIHGRKDPGVNPGISEAVFNLTPGRMSLLMIDDGDHTSGFAGKDGALMAKVIVAFLDTELGIDPDAMQGLEAEVTGSGLGSLRSKQQ
jgi:dienelactone hydrolase